MPPFFPANSSRPSSKSNLLKRLKNFNWAKIKPSSKKQWLIGGAVILVLIGGGGFGGYSWYKKVSHTAKKNEQAESRTVYTPPKPKTEPSRLTGVEVDPALNKRPVTAVMIENSPDARPQSGLKNAGIVFEAVAEGGITRFCALFQEAQPDYIGPVRSVRPYYIDLFMPFDASIAHAGGSGQGLAKLRSLGTKDLDEFANSGGYFRASSRFAPHNLYTTMAKLDALNQAKGYTSSNFSSWQRKAEKPATAPTATSMDFSLSGFFYNPHFDYVVATNSYKRSEAGVSHVDEKSGAQLSPKVVMALVMNYSHDGIYSVYQTSGSGSMYVFQDGMATKGTWSKAGTKDQFVFTDSGGQPLKLNAGQTWVTLVASDSAVSYK